VSKSRREKQNLRTGLPERRLLIQLLAHHIDMINGLIVRKSPNLQVELALEERDTAQGLIDQILE
jgi:hypothetical protein